MDDPLTTGTALEMLRNGFSLLREILGLAKDVNNTLPSGDKKEAIEKGLVQAERQLALAEAQIAQGLGYHLCKCTFPPQIMLSVGQHGRQQEFRCPKCNSKWPPPETAALEPEF